MNKTAMRIAFAILISVFFSTNSVIAQGIAINSEGYPPHASSVLDISSSTQGLLIPRMTLTQRNNISSPATGLLIYQTDNTPGFYYYNGSAWISAGTVTGTGSATRLAFWTGASSIGSDALLYWNNSSNRLGINIATPLETLHVNGSVRGNQSGAVRISTGNGYVDIGPKNSSWSHFYTDRPRFYFQKGITVDEGLIGSYNENLYLQTSGATRITALTSNGYVGIGTTSPAQRLDVNGYVEMNNGYAIGATSTNMKITSGRINIGSMTDGLRRYSAIPHGLTTVSQIVVSVHTCSDTGYQVHPSGVQACTFISSGIWSYCVENKSGGTRNVEVVWMAFGTD